MAATFGASGLGFGAQSGWVIQDSTADDENKRANVLNESGIESTSKLHDQTTQVTTTYKAADVNSTPTIPALGSVIGGAVVTSISVSTDAEDFATMTLTGHEHIDGDHGSVRTFSHGMSLDAAFGASAFGVGGGREIAEVDGLRHLIGLEILVDRFRDERRERRGNLTQAEQHVVQRGIGLHLVGIIL